MSNIVFFFNGKRGLIERHPAFFGGAFVQFGGMGFHYNAARGELKRAVDAAISKAEEVA